MSTSFDCFDVLDQSLASESQEKPRKIEYKRQNLNSFETQISLSLEPLSSYGSDSNSQESEGSQNQNRKIIKKAKRSRKLKDNSTWIRKDEVKYWKFYLIYKTKNPHLKVSWHSWKRDSIYKHMATYIGKTPKQCKSKDQNMKTKNHQHLLNGKDILDIAILKLQEFKESDADIEIVIEEYKALLDKKSEHMRMLEEKSELQQLEAVKIEEMMKKF